MYFCPHVIQITWLLGEFGGERENFDSRLSLLGPLVATYINLGVKIQLFLWPGSNGLRLPSSALTLPRPVCPYQYQYRTNAYAVLHCVSRCVDGDGVGLNYNQLQNSEQWRKLPHLFFNLT